MTPDTRIIDLTVFELQLLIERSALQSINKALEAQYNQQMQNRTYTIHELGQLNIVGKYTKIKNLISSGDLKVTPDGKITGSSVYSYLNQK